MSTSIPASTAASIPAWRADVIAVLGFNNDAEHPVTLARVSKAVELHRNGIAPFLLMTGRCSVRHLADPPEVTEAAAMRDVAVRMGLPPWRVLVEEQSVNTIGNAYWPKVGTLLPSGWTRVAVVSTEGHAELGAWLFERVCGPEYEVRAFPVPHPLDRDGALARGRAAREEYVRACDGFVDGDHEAFRAVLEI